MALISVSHTSKRVNRKPSKIKTALSSKKDLVIIIVILKVRKCTRVLCINTVHVTAYDWANSRHALSLTT